MTAAKTYYFYLWQHRFVDDATDQVIARTCFGITGNPEHRVQGYEGHVGHVVKFTRLWSGPERLIRELETRVKSDFAQQIVVGTRGFRYEWIDQTVTFDTVVKWVEWEVENTFGNIAEVKEA